MVEIDVAGVRLGLLPQRAALLVEQRCLLVADAHIGKAVSYRKLGVPVPEATTGGNLEAIDALLHKRLPGFGELFRMLSYHDIGAAAMLSRACAGTIGRVVVISLPGSENAVRLAMSKLVVPELGHLVQQANK